MGRTNTPTSDEAVYAFVHIPFSGGTTIRNAIHASCAEDEVLDCYGWRRSSESIASEIHSMPSARRQRLRFLLGHQVWFGIDALFDREVRYFTFLRNPIARAVSAYLKIQRKKENFFHDIVSGMTLEQFADQLPICRNHATVLLGRSSVDDNHNYSACVDDNQELLAQAYTNLSRCWFVGLHETFANDEAELSRALGLTRVEPANVRPASQESADVANVGAYHGIARHNVMDLCLYSSAVIARERAQRTASRR